ncbi:geranylgeranyl diphosphate reductase [Roseinatronobacter bogoriensis]|uniref:Geranylgeranyl diphosphate reductase n=1 Tax=Roseinatronobacter bogoriensis subsp. barguzinensis TaxID=441209 RepID=A0A2K8K651_9RHOB|nr:MULTISPECIES: geranylgeranyl diphosphate reductase [Rhodobaca]ATX64921.1 geranylgeranyl diphosphate reductase [Rhodobaca barguzinensis]MBB4208733.1 geranylgeranyl reductase [Rhodobaca bogoriensis DSM 18756]TDW37999.1 geranylgeranyl reductase [Rhodobaca barguzinensis]TDY69831.1 geranylgeranyl reductase [Rhodobaca bogoriensis DSM 18756]
MKYDVFVVGGGPSGATAADDLARAGKHVALLDRAGRIKPCGGAIPPRAIADFDIPMSQIVAQITTARMISPTGRAVDIPIENGYVGMVDREDFDEFLRVRAAEAGADRLTGTFLRIERDAEGTHVVWRDKATGEERRSATKLVIGADGARSNVARAEVPGGDKIPYVIAYHEIIKAPPANDFYDPDRCDVIYDGRISSDFYGWVFPHGKHASVGMGTEINGADLKKATADLRAMSGLSDCETIRREGAPIPLRPMDRWDNGRDVVLAGDAAGVVAPSSGEGIYYAMVGGRVAATAAQAALASGKAKDLALARKLFMREHKTVFRVLRQMQDAYYKSDERRERFVSLCHDIDVQRLTFEAYMNKKLVAARPLAHVKIGIKNMLHLTGLVRPSYT